MKKYNLIMNIDKIVITITLFYGNKLYNIHNISRYINYVMVVLGVN